MKADHLKLRQDVEAIPPKFDRKLLENNNNGAVSILQKELEKVREDKIALQNNLIGQNGNNIGSQQSTQFLTV